MDFISLRFLEKNENIIFCGTLGVEKTNLTASIGIEAAKQRYCVYFITFQDLISDLKKASDECSLTLFRKDTKNHLLSLPLIHLFQSGLIYFKSRC